MSININKPLLNWERFIPKKKYTINDSKPISKKRSTVYTISIVIFFLINVFLFAWTFSYVEIPEVSTSPILFYGRPDAAIFVSGSIMVFYSVFVGMFFIVKKFKHKMLSFMITEGLLLGFAIISLKTSYYAVTNDVIYYKYLFQQRVYNLSQVKSIEIPCASNKSLYYTEVDVKLTDETAMVFKGNIDNDNLINFDKKCVNANRRVDNRLIEEHNDIMREALGEKNYNYIMTN